MPRAGTHVSVERLYGLDPERDDARPPALSHYADHSRVKVNVRILGIDLQTHDLGRSRPRVDENPDKGRVAEVGSHDALVNRPDGVKRRPVHACAWLCSGITGGAEHSAASCLPKLSSFLPVNLRRRLESVPLYRL